MLRSALSCENAWRIRIVALGFIVLCVGTGSQLLVNAVAASAEMTTTTTITTLKVTAYTMVGRMADGNWTRAGACAASGAQFPLGSVLALYDADGTFDRQCTVEDTDSSIAYGQIELAMPGDEISTIHWGVRYLSVQVVRLGWGADGPPNLSTTSPLLARHIKARLVQINSGL